MVGRNCLDRLAGSCWSVVVDKHYLLVDIHCWLVGIQIQGDCRCWLEDDKHLMVQVVDNPH